MLLCTEKFLKTPEEIRANFTPSASGKRYIGERSPQNVHAFVSEDKLGDVLGTNSFFFILIVGILQLQALVITPKKIILK